MNPQRRVPMEIDREVVEIQKKLRISYTAAMRLWKQTKLGIKWENF